MELALTLAIAGLLMQGAAIVWLSVRLGQAAPSGGVLRSAPPAKQPEVAEKQPAFFHGLHGVSTPPDRKK